MPWYIHERSSDPLEGSTVVWQSRKEAQEIRTSNPRQLKNPVVTFKGSYAEIQGWKFREQDRFDSEMYMRVPWHSATWQTDQTIGHYAHLSVENPGLIAYTPSDEFGVEDRQLRVRPGKYLAEFANHLTKKEVDEYCAKCREYDKTIELHFAVTPEEIVRVYKGGPDSCMSGSGKFHNNPVTAYGNSDLQLAYIGSIDDAQARCLVWPEKMLYSRAYGNEHVIKFQLEKVGYKAADRWRLHGARIRAIECREGWLMPYTDCAGSASLVQENGAMWFRLGSGEFETATTDGFVSENDPEPEYSTCANCGDECDMEEQYCCTCRRDRFHCVECDEHVFGRDESTVTCNGRICSSCAENLTVECAIESCNATWIETEEFSYDESVRRNLNHTDPICRSCEEKYQHCQSCDTFYPTDTVKCPACSITVRCSETVSLTLESANESPV